MTPDLPPDAHPSVNVLGRPLARCGDDPPAGVFRTGTCDTCDRDVGNHSVCAVMTAEFLEFTAAQGNDLSTPRPEFDFPGLKPGDRWCLCAARWLEAEAAGAAPKVDLRATHRRALDVAPRETLEAHAIPAD